MGVIGGREGFSFALILRCQSEIDGIAMEPVLLCNR